MQSDLARPAHEAAREKPFAAVHGLRDQKLNLKLKFKPKIHLIQNGSSLNFSYQTVMHTPKRRRLEQKKSGSKESF